MKAGEGGIGLGVGVGGCRLEKLIHQVITGGGSCGISACPSVEEEEDGERVPEEDRSSAVLPPSYTPVAPPPLFLPRGRPCPASPLTAHLLTAITPPSSSPPSHCLPLYLPPLLHLSLSLSLSPSSLHILSTSLALFLFTFLPGGSP